MKLNNDSNAAWLAPLIAPLLMIIVLLVSGHSLLSSAFTAFFTGLISYIGFRIFILPLHNYLKVRNKANMLALLISGLIGGSLVVSSLYFLLGNVLGSWERFDLSTAAIGALFGGGVAVVFSLLSGTTNLMPDKDRGSN